MKKIISPTNPVDELGITNALKNLEEIDKQIADWCKKL